jgi:acyl-CoA reductase-like NAD-dependent aldehyde dehydrogenase
LIEQKLFIDGQWVEGGSLLEMTNKFTGAVIGALPTARREDIDVAIAAAQRAAEQWSRCLPASAARF